MGDVWLANERPFELMEPERTQSTTNAGSRHRSRRPPNVLAVAVHAGVCLASLETMLGGPDGATRRSAREAREVLVPLTDRLGLTELRSRLEDASFRVLQPTTFRAMSTFLERTRRADESCLALVSARLSLLMEEAGLAADVTGRLKSVWGIYRKVWSPRPSPILDKIGVRIVVPSKADCYRVLELVHEHFQVIPKTFDDYVRNPKGNGYQSLHTCVLARGLATPRPVEIQIRTHAMHREAELGRAAHWRYKKLSTERRNPQASPPFRQHRVELTQPVSPVPRAPSRLSMRGNRGGEGARIG